MSDSKNIVIVGGGLVGSLLSCFLSKRGHRVFVFERRSDFRNSEYVGGRSINLALSERGINALKRVGIMEKVEKLVIPMIGRRIHKGEDETYFQPYGNEGQFINSVSRGQLNQLMIAEADAFPNVQFYFDQKLISADLEKNILLFQNTVTGELSKVHGDLVFGADGAFSELRMEMQKLPGFNLHQVYEPYGYKELSIPANPDGSHKLDKNALHIWPRDSFMMIALPNLDGSFTNTLFASFHGPNSFDGLKTKEEVHTFFKEQFPDAYPQMPHLEEEFFCNPTSSLVTIRSFPWSYKKVCLLGDAAHAIVPFYGQGMNCGFEDVFVLNDLLDKMGEKWEQVFKEFEALRKPNADAILDLALYNYIEMRDLAGKDWFQLRLKIEKHIANHFPDKFKTLYSMVTFSNIPYAEAKAKGEKQSELLKELLNKPGIFEDWEKPWLLERAKEWIEKNS